MALAAINGHSVAGEKLEYEPHAVHEIRGAHCCGCEMLSCIRQRSRLHPWRFWCNPAHKNVDPYAPERCIRDELAAVPPKPETYYEWLSRRMSELGIRNVDLERAVGVGQTTVSHWKMGKTKPRGKHLEAVERIVGKYGEC